MEAMIRAVDPTRMAWIILRGGSFVGPGTRQDQVIASLRDGSLRVPGDGSNWVSFVHVDDYADAVVAALRSPARDVILNITDEPVRNGDYLDRLATMLGLPAPERNPAAELPRSYRCTSAAAREILGWRPTRGIWPSPVA
jgi:nucleoside-diphosphate-sugar epimerase